MWLSIILGFVSVIGIYLRWNGTYWKRRGVVGPNPLPIVGNMLDYIREKKHYGEVYDEIYRYPKTVCNYNQLVLVSS